MERLPLDRSVLDSALERMDIADIAQDSRPNRSASKPNAKPSGRAWRRSTPACPAFRN